MQWVAAVSPPDLRGQREVTAVTPTAFNGNKLSDGSQVGLCPCPRGSPNLSPVPQGQISKKAIYMKTLV